jgi:RecA-family ATPase
VFFVTGVQEGKETRAFDPAKDMLALRAAIAAIKNVRLIIVDPIVSAVQGDSHKNAETRRGLAPLVELASHIGAALIGITHFSKGTSGREPIERITGSLAFGALARVVLIAAKESDGEDGGEGRRIFARLNPTSAPTKAASPTD